MGAQAARARPSRAAELAESVGDLGDVGLIDPRQDLRIEAVALAELVALLERNGAQIHGVRQGLS